VQLEDVVQDQRFYSCIGNMIWLPTPLKGFTDAVPQIKECLRVCAFQLYGWACEHEDVRTVAERVRSGAIPEGYPNDWPTADRRVLPPGTASCTERVQASIEKRLEIVQRVTRSSRHPIDARLCRVAGNPGPGGLL
jgi:hypothetical protein